MFQVLISAAGLGTLLASLVIAPSWAQYDLDTCEGRLSYCVEWARRAGTPDSQCQASYQECLRTGVRPRRDLYNPYAGARPSPNNPYPGAVDRRDSTNPYSGPIEQQFCVGRVNCLPQR
jgi:hypothetical protein